MEWFRFFILLVSSGFLILSLVIPNQTKSNNNRTFELVSVHRKDFLSASDARKDLDEYWADLERKTSVENGKSRVRSSETIFSSTHDHQALVEKTGTRDHTNEPELNSKNLVTSGMLRNAVMRRRVADSLFR